MFERTKSTNIGRQLRVLAGRPTLEVHAKVRQGYPDGSRELSHQAFVFSSRCHLKQFQRGQGSGL